MGWEKKREEGPGERKGSQVWEGRKATRKWRLRAEIVREERIEKGGRRKERLIDG